MDPEDSKLIIPVDLPEGYDANITFINDTPMCESASFIGYEWVLFFNTIRIGCGYVRYDLWDPVRLKEYANNHIRTKGKF